MKAAAVFLLVCTIFWGMAYAGQSPDALVKETTEKVITQLSDNREALEADVSLLYQMVDEIVLPHFDFTRMSKLVLGKHWKNASDTQRQRFEQEFKALLVRTYATALFEYTGQEIVYKPFRMKENSDRAVVKTEVVPNDGPRIPLHYALKKGNGDAWLVYDFRIDGLSMVTQYRTSYGHLIESRGMDKLIERLGEKRKALGLEE